MESFKRVLAPFDGVVTQRNTDIGALINAGQSPGAALFRVADTHRLRIYVSVPQAYASSIRPGMKAELVFAEHPGQTYPATVAFTAQALDPASRTLQVELQVGEPAAQAISRILRGSALQPGRRDAHIAATGECGVVPRPGTAGRRGRER